MEMQGGKDVKNKSIVKDKVEEAEWKYLDVTHTHTHTHNVNIMLIL